MKRFYTFTMSPEPAPASPAPAPAPTPTPAPAPAPAPADPAAPPAPADPKQTVLTGKPPADPAAPAPTPEEISVKFPEGVKFEKTRLDQFTKIAKEIGLKSEGAQKMADFYVEMRRAEATAQVEMITKWAEDAKADKEIGGSAFEENVKVAKRALDRVGSPALKELLATSGFGNHVEVIRLFAKIGKVIAEDRLPGGDDNDPNKEPSLEEQVKEAYPASPGMWGNNTKK